LHLSLRCWTNRTFHVQSVDAGALLAHYGSRAPSGKRTNASFTG
jgi:hypothetical protein